MSNLPQAPFARVFWLCRSIMFQPATGCGLWTAWASDWMNLAWQNDGLGRKLAGAAVRGQK